MIKNQWAAFAAVSVLAISLSAQAADGDKGGNGGGGEIEFRAIQAEISVWMKDRLADGTLDQKLDLKNSGTGLDGRALYAKFLAFSATPVLYQDAPIAIGGYSTAPAGRICGNGATPAHIECNNGNWNATSQATRFSIVLHEILGVAGIEINQGEYSQYPISKNIFQYVQLTTKFELGKDAGRFKFVGDYEGDLLENGAQWGEKHDLRVEHVEDENEPYKLQSALGLHDRFRLPFRDTRYFAKEDKLVATKDEHGLHGSTFWTRLTCTRNEDQSLDCIYETGGISHADPTPIVSRLHMIKVR